MTQLTLFNLLDARPVLPRPAITAPPSKLAPCPFCTSDRIEWSKTKDTIYVYCEGCGAEMHGVGPKASHYVTLRWNTRTTSADATANLITPNGIGGFKHEQAR